LLFHLRLPLALAADPAEPAEVPPPPPKEEKKFPDTKVSGILFAHYGYLLTDGSDGYNEFGLDRAYLVAESKLSGHLATRLTLDADRLKATTLPDDSEVTVDTKYRVFVKHAYLEGRWESYGLKTRGGIIDTPYAPYYDKFVGIRYVIESFPKQNKVLETADIGAGLWGNHADGLLDWNVSLLNGEGYSKPEIDEGKAVQARVIVDPLAKGEMNLPITGFVSMNGQPSVGDPIITAIGAVGFKQDYLVAWAEYLLVMQGDLSGGGYSATLAPKAPDVGGLLLRYDHFDPNADADDDASDTIIAGVTHDFVEKVSLAGTYERITPEATPDAPGRSVFVHMQAGF
jgi:hypothetical protein